MNGMDGRVLATSRVRADIVPAADLRSEVAFQNDVNALIAAVWHLGTGRAMEAFLDVQAPFGCLPPSDEVGATPAPPRRWYTGIAETLRRSIGVGVRWQMAARSRIA